MNEDELVGLYVCILLVAVFVGGLAGYFVGYNDGQVDAINGEIKYELQLQKDGTTAWKETK